MPELDPARRAVVTGLGAVMPIGNDFPTYWSNLVAGVTGTRTISSFDPSGFEVKIAAEVLDFDPTIAMDAKMARRMSRFIHFAMAAGKEAVTDSGIDFAAMSQEQRDRVGVVVNTGGGGSTLAGDQRDEVDDGSHDGRRRCFRGIRDRDVGGGAVRSRDPELPRLRSRLRRLGRERDAGPADSLRPVEQHRARWT